MKTFLHKTLTIAAFVALACWNQPAVTQEFDAGESDFDGGTELRSVLTIHADGSNSFIMTSVQPRAMAEQQIRTRERYETMNESSGEETPPPAETVTNETKPFTDLELTKKYSEMMDERAESTGETIKVEVTTNAVATIATWSFASLEDLLKESSSFGRGGAVVTFRNTRFETDSNGLLRATFTPEPGMDRYVKTFRSQWKLSGARSEFKMVFPGKVVSSDFPATETNATWLIIDGKREETLDAAAKFYTNSAVVTAEAGGGLKLPQPLDSKTLRRARRMASPDDLPLTEAGPGFLAEAQSITTTTLHVFPGGEEYFKNNATMTGAVVTAKFFAPKGRTLQSVGNARVLSATDNAGRSVAPAMGDDEENTYSSYTGNSTGSGDANSMAVDLRLQLPQPDAQSIDRISAEAEAITAGTWKEMTLTNLQENATNDLDLSLVLPGAKLAITKVSFKNGQFRLQARLHGPSTTKRLKLSAKIPGNENFQSYSSEQQAVKKGDEFSRAVTIQGFGFEAPGTVSPDIVTLLVRYPEDLKRERVTFELKNLDLF